MTRPERKIDFGGDTWAAHRQDHWLDWAGNPNFSDYQRLVFAAYGRHAANGHAVLERGELARYLVRKDGTLPERRILWNALQKAIRLGYLSDGSKLLCLVVPAHDVRGGKGNPDERCRRDHTTRSRASGAGRFQTSAAMTDVPDETSVTAIDVSDQTSVTTTDVSGSRPLSLLPTPTPEEPAC